MRDKGVKSRIDLLFGMETCTAVHVDDSVPVVTTVQADDSVPVVTAVHIDASMPMVVFFQTVDL